MIVKTMLLCVILSLSGIVSASACKVPSIRTFHGQTVDGQMYLKSGTRCSIIVRSSRGPTHGAEIIARPAHGTVSLGSGNRVTYVSRRGFIGQDSFTYARTGLDHLNNESRRTVRVAVTVSE
jgi:hypothetical protein